MKQLYGLLAEISVGVTFTAFMGTVALFFTGILIAQLKSFDPSIKVPILFLIISTFSFIFSASIYSNASGEVARHDQERAHVYMAIGNVVSEFLGLYLFTLSVPLVINAITKDQFLRISVALIVLTGLIAYSQSSFSILHRELVGISKTLFTATVGALGLLLFLSQLHILNYYSLLASFTLVFMVSATIIFGRASRQLENFQPSKLD